MHYKGQGEITYGRTKRINKKNNNGFISELICMDCGASHKIAVTIKLRGPSEKGVRMCEATVKKIGQIEGHVKGVMMM